MKYVYVLSHIMQIISVGSRDETVLQYINILQFLLLQYDTTWLKGNIDILCNYATNSICINFLLLYINFLLYKHDLSRD